MIDKNVFNNFETNGFCMIPPGVIFSEEEIQKLESLVISSLPEWSEGIVDPKINNSRFDSRFSIASKLDDKISLNGCALEHRFYRGAGSVDTSKDNNFLFGKRATIIERNWNSEINQFVEDERLNGVISNLLGCQKLSFHNGSISSVYPGCTGESRQFHIDTGGFLANSKTPIPKEKFVVNAMIFLSDINEELAPMRVIPKSHKKYSEINTKLAKSFKGDEKYNNVPQAGQLWEELLPEGLEPPIFLTGKKGSIVFMNSSLLHSATENRSKDMTRKVMILNFSSKEDIFFSKDYSFDPSGCLKFYNNFKNRELVEHTFLSGSKRKLKKHFKKALQSLRTKVKSSPKKFISLANRGVKKLTTPKNVPIENKKYLNIGAGTNWRHPNVICLDFDPKGAEVSLNLNHHAQLPFPELRFEGIYSSHCLEHLKENQVKWWLSESLRVLKKGGVIRITVPDIEAYFDAYEKGDASYFDWIRGRNAYQFDSWLRLIVRAFAEPVVDNYTDDELYQMYSQMSREDFLKFFNTKVSEVTDERFLAPDCHKSWWSEKKMIEALKNAGFSKAEAKSQRDSFCKLFQETGFNNTRPGMSFFVEAVK